VLFDLLLLVGELDLLYEVAAILGYDLGVHLKRP
jgi:hypothetical protein